TISKEKKEIEKIFKVVYCSKKQKKEIEKFSKVDFNQDREQNLHEEAEIPEHMNVLSTNASRNIILGDDEATSRPRTKKARVRMEQKVFVFFVSQ
ncbi:hypothetical protein PIB30_053094, partial [Stylosanthes scabra]|nr:hypothetical protein [Stylosanthes scabra]